MPRKKSNQPGYRYHISGQAVVTLCGKNFYLGEHDSPDSWAKYYALIADYNASGKKAPPSTETHQAEIPITVRHVVAEFRQSIERRPAEQSRCMALLDLLDSEYGDSPANEFGPRKLAELRELFVKSGNCRSYVNRQVREVIRVFRHAVCRELIPVEIVTALGTLPPLRRAYTEAKEAKRRMPVDIQIVRATVRHLSPVVAAMVRMQVATGMRPSELFNMRPVDVDRSGDCWFYRPQDHKTAGHGITKAVPILGDAREALTPFLLRDADAYCFSPAESAQWHRDRRRANRKTPEHYGNRPGTNRKPEPQRPPGKQFTKDSYRKAVERACEAANVTRWTPYQLRHLTATAIREAVDIETAKHLLGHSDVSMTEHYAKVSEKRAVEAAKVAPQVGKVG